MSILRYISRIIPDKLYIQLMYYKHFGRLPDLENPKTFNEKLQWLKLHDRRPEYTLMVDKVEAKKYVAEIIGDEYIIPTLGVWDSVEDIDFTSLPNQFVLKCNNDSGGIIICKDKSKLDIQSTKKFLKKRLKNNGYWYGREWPYKNVKPKILAEQFLSDETKNDLYDFKFFCFNGKAKCFKVDYDRFKEHHANYFDIDGNLIDMGEASLPPQPDKIIEIPNELQEMKELAESLSKERTFLRCDFYDINGLVYFGEMTLYPASGFGKFITEKNDEMLGKWIKLPFGGGYILISHLGIIRYVETNVTNGVNDYKIYCFNGEPKLVLVCQNRFSSRGINEDFFDIFWNHVNLSRPNIRHSGTEVRKPARFEEMLFISQKIANTFPFIRVDFYEIQAKIYIGELTFYPTSGFQGFLPTEMDITLGNQIKLSTS